MQLDLFRFPWTRSKLLTVSKTETHQLHLTDPGSRPQAMQRDRTPSHTRGADRPKGQPSRGQTCSPPGQQRITVPAAKRSSLLRQHSPNHARSQIPQSPTYLGKRPHKRSSAHHTEMYCPCPTKLWKRQLGTREFERPWTDFWRQLIFLLSCQRLLN